MNSNTTAGRGLSPGPTTRGPTPSIAPLDLLVPIVSLTSRFPEVGGSNFVFIRQSHFTNRPFSVIEAARCAESNPHGHRTGDRRSVIAVYHQAQEFIDRQLMNLHRSGQRKVSLIVWHFTAPGEYPDDQDCMAVRVNGRLTAQHERNFRNLVARAKSIGFDQINIRFAPVEASAPGSWMDWNEDLFQSNWNLIVNTRAATYEALSSVSGANPKILFDLGLELGGEWLPPATSKPQLRRYVARMWSHYRGLYGAQDTMGFSIVPAGNSERFIDTIRIYDEGGGRPRAYGFDLYGNMDQVRGGNFVSLIAELDSVREGLRYVGELGSSREVFVQETYMANDAWVQLLLSESKVRGLNFRYVFQWPLETNFAGQGAANAPHLNDFGY